MTTALWVLGGALLGGAAGTTVAFSVIVALWAIYEGTGLIVSWALRRGRARGDL